MISYSAQERHTVQGGIAIDVMEEGLQKAIRLMQGFPGSAKKAVGSAIARSANSGKTAAKRAVTEDYTISGGTFLGRTRNINHFQQSGDGSVSVVFGYAGAVIPLMKFETTPSSAGVVTNVRRTTGAKRLQHAFVRTMYTHVGVYEREGKERLPIRELFGPSTPQMMYSDENVMDKLEEKVVETFEKRIDHEILRVMNGWGK